MRRVWGEPGQAGKGGSSLGSKNTVGVASEGRIEVVKSIPISFIGKTEV